MRAARCLKTRTSSGKQAYATHLRSSHQWYISRFRHGAMHSSLQGSCTIRRACRPCNPAAGLHDALAAMFREQITFQTPAATIRRSAGALACHGARVATAALAASLDRPLAQNTARKRKRTMLLCRHYSLCRL